MKFRILDLLFIVTIVAMWCVAFDARNRLSEMEAVVGYVEGEVQVVRQIVCCGNGSI
jgi:hypothetical protein